MLHHPHARARPSRFQTDPAATPLHFQLGEQRRAPVDQLRARMIGDGSTPTIFCFSTCLDSIRTIPVLQHDPNRAEDLDTNSEDHAADDMQR
jgi:hypothetical protein